jgi:hypothetical protein
MSSEMKYIGYLELDIADTMWSSLPDYVALQFRNPINKPFDEGFLGVVLVLPLRQSSVQGEPHGTISKIPKPSDKNVKVL